MEKFYVAVCLLVGCTQLDPPPLSDGEVLETAAALWADRYGWSPACEEALEHVHIVYVPVGGACSAENDACVHIRSAEILITDRARLDARRLELIAHESAHLFLSCSFRAPGGDPDHTADDVWQEWVYSTTRRIADE